MKKTKIISWKKYFKDIYELVDTLKYLHQTNEFCGVYGIPRGGLIPAIIISHHLNIPYLQSMPKTDRKVLIVEDIIDSGKTYKDFKKTYSGLYKEDQLIFSAIYCYSHNELEDNDLIIFTELINENTNWVVFPYEVDNR